MRARIRTVPNLPASSARGRQGTVPAAVSRAGLVRHPVGHEDSGPGGADRPEDQGAAGQARARVLVVEDEALVAMTISDSLEALGHEVCAVADTADGALAMALSCRPDVVLMDVNLKGSRDGIAAAADIRAALPARIVFLTAFSDPATRARMAAVGPAGIMTKPYADAELGRIVAQALSGMGGP